MCHKLFRLEPELDINIVGDSRQIEGVESPYFLRGERSFLRLNNPKIEPAEIDLPRFELAKKAKVTDYMELSYNGYFKLISQKFRSLLDEFSVDNIDFYEVKVITQNQPTQIHNYYLITSRSNAVDRVIDWNKSSLVWWHMYTKKIEKYLVDIDSYSKWVLYWTDKIPKEDENWRVRFHKFVLNQYTCDFVQLRGPLLGFFVSSKFKNRLIEEKLTGFTFSTLEKFEVKEQRLS